jgi:hypothetical protein
LGPQVANPDVPITEAEFRRQHAELPGRKPGIVVYVKAGSGRLMREFRRFCGHAGIDAHPVQEMAESRPLAYECIGTVESLERLIGHPAVANWHYILNVRPPVQSIGSGPEKARPGSGTVFGKPATVAATTAQLAADRSKRMTAERARETR